MGTITVIFRSDVVEENVSDEAQGREDCGWLMQTFYQQSGSSLAGREF